MSLNQYTKEEINEMSLIEVAYEILQGNRESKQAIAFKDLVQKIAELQGLSTVDIQQRIAQFYTDLNVDGRFNTVGENHWGLKDWYPIDQIEDEMTNPVKPKKKKGKKVVDDEFEDIIDADDLDEFDDIEEDVLDEEEDILAVDDADDDLDEDELIEDDFEIDDEDELEDEDADDLL